MSNYDYYDEDYHFYIKGNVFVYRKDQNDVTVIAPFGDVDCVKKDDEDQTCGVFFKDGTGGVMIKRRGEQK